MSNHVLPAHEFFIYVPSLCKSAAPVSTPDVRKEADTICHEAAALAYTEELQGASNPVDLTSWTKIDLADTVSLYIRL